MICPPPSLSSCPISFCHLNLSPLPFQEEDEVKNEEQKVKEEEESVNEEEESVDEEEESVKEEELSAKEEESVKEEEVSPKEEDSIKDEGERVIKRRKGNKQYCSHIGGLKNDRKTTKKQVKNEIIKHQYQKTRSKNEKKTKCDRCCSAMVNVGIQRPLYLQYVFRIYVPLLYGLCKLIIDK